MTEHIPKEGRWTTTVKRENSEGKVKRFVITPARKFYYGAIDQEDPKKARVQA